MGRIFLEHINEGEVFYNCARCDANLTSRSEIISKRFTGRTGRSYLFNKVVNVTFGEIQNKVMMTGNHKIRDVFCKKCKSKLGWIYEFASNETQRYKEGRIVLELALISESEF